MRLPHSLSRPRWTRGDRADRAAASDVCRRERHTGAPPVPGARAALLAALVLAALLWVAVPAAHAQTPDAAGATLGVTIDRTEVTVGDRISVTLTLRLPADAQPDLSALDRQFGDLDVLFVGLPDVQALPDGRSLVRARYEVAAFRPGATAIPILTVPYTTAAGSATVASAQPLPVTVTSVLQVPEGEDPGDIRDLKPQIDLSYRGGLSWRAVLPALAAAVAVAAAVAGLLWWRARRRRPAPAPVSTAATPAYESAALAELDRIAGLGLVEEGKLREFHALLAACIRRYLSERFGFPAFALTTSELAGRMEREGIDRWPARLATGLLTECDAVEYAGYVPAAARAGTSLDIAREIVVLTREAADPAAVVS